MIPLTLRDRKSREKTLYMHLIFLFYSKDNFSIILYVWHQSKKNASKKHAFGLVQRGRSKKLNCKHVKQSFPRHTFLHYFRGKIVLYIYFSCQFRTGSSTFWIGSSCLQVHFFFYFVEYYVTGESVWVGHILWVLYQHQDSSQFYHLTAASSVNDTNNWQLQHYWHGCFLSRNV